MKWRNNVSKQSKKFSNFLQDKNSFLGIYPRSTFNREIKNLKMIATIQMTEKRITKG